MFWDVDSEKLDIEESKWYIIKRTLNYGLINDWNLIYKHYGIEVIAEHATSYRDLDMKSASLIALLAKIPLEKFRCYTTKQLNQTHWNF